MKTINNVTTGEIISRELNKAEMDQQKIDEAAFKIKLTEQENKAEAKAELLKRLGITEDEAKLLLS